MTDVNGKIVVDEKNRQLTLRTLDVLEEARLVRMLGSDTTNMVYMNGYVIPTVSVAAIDGEAFDLPRSLRELEGNIKQLGAHGIKAVLSFLRDSGEDSEQEGEDALKNS